MLIENISFEQLKATIDKISAKSRLQRNYQIVDIKKIEEDLNKKNCLLFCNDETAILLIPIFDYYDCFLFFSDDKQLIDDFQNLLHLDIFKHKIIKLSFCDNRNFVNVTILEKLLNIGFTVKNKIARFNSDNNYELVSKLYALVPEEYKKVEYANVEDAQEILELMKGDFDTIKDNIPELDDIKANIAGKQVLCVKHNNQIVSFHYFKVVNNIYYGLFDFTRREYRQFFVFFAIANYVENLEKTNQTKYQRKYGWRDIDNKRTNKFAHLNKEKEDGVMICNLIYTLNRDK